MAQTTGGMSFYAALVKYSSTNEAWAAMSDISGEGTAVSAAGGDRAFGEVNTFTGDVPIVTPGKRGSVSVTVRVVYTDSALEAFNAIRALYETAGGFIRLAWSPNGTGTTVFEVWRNETFQGIITAFAYPGGEAGDGAPALCEFTVTGSRIESL